MFIFTALLQYQKVIRNDFTENNDNELFHILIS